jgi:hypothetical protein
MRSRAQERTLVAAFPAQPQTKKEREMNAPDATFTNGRYELPPHARGVLVLADPPEAGWIRTTSNEQATTTAEQHGERKPDRRHASSRESFAAEDVIPDMTSFRTAERPSPVRVLFASLLFFLALAVLPAGASAANTFVDATAPNNNGDCLTPATACKTIGGADGAIAKASPGFAVHVEPGTYTENVTLAGGVSLVADSGNPVIAPPTGAAVTAIGTPPVTINGLTFGSSTDGAEVLLGDAAGNAIVTDNSFIDRTPGDANHPIGIRTTSTAAPKIAVNGFAFLHDAIEVLPPAAGAPGRPEITANNIIGTPDFGAGVLIQSPQFRGVTGPTTASLVGNDIEEGANQSTGVLIADGGSIVGDPVVPGAGVTMVRNRILGGGDGLFDFGGRASVSLFDDVIAEAARAADGFSPIRAFANAGIGGDLTVTNADLLSSADPAIQLSDDHLALDSSIVAGSIFEVPGTAASCTITFSAGPTTSGDSCQTFQTNATPSFFNADNPAGSDFHLNPALDQAFIDQGNPADPPLGQTLDLDGEARVIDGACPIGAVRDIGADEFNPGSQTCPPPGTPPGGGNPGGPPGGGAQASPPPTGLRAAALKKCKHKHGKARGKCTRKAKHLPV